ncbi:MAG: hypothetical protein LBQ60_01075 [Bacteroidales bacterium]|jgi:hypothetical protein|nr:hypothetical protein [Bacteroidales bacterium]
MAIKYLFLFLFYSPICLAQSDTIFVFAKLISSSFLEGNKYEQDSIIYKNSTYNIRKDSLKEGQWLYWEYFNPERSVVYETTNSTILYEIDPNIVRFFIKNGLNSFIIKSNYYIKVKGKYINGKKEGKWEVYLPEGNLYKELIYKNDVLQKFIVYNDLKEIECNGKIGANLNFIITKAGTTKKIQMNNKEVEDIFGVNDKDFPQVVDVFVN